MGDHVHNFLTPGVVGKKTVGKLGSFHWYSAFRGGFDGYSIA
jgi:hypothetical protein